MDRIIKKSEKNPRRLLKRIAITTVSIIAILVFCLFLFVEFYTPSLSENYGKVDAKLYLGDSDNQPLIVAFGGSQGGNSWTEDHWSEIRNRFLQQGYAVLSIGYANTENTPETIDRISLNAIYDTIKGMSTHPKIDTSKIALLGSSKGGELVLNLASRYDDIDAVVALVPSHVTFPGYTITANTSAWMYDDKEVEFIQIPYYKLIWAVLKDDPQTMRKILLESEESSKDAQIEVEKINASILLLSAQNDEAWPSDYMSDQVMKRLEENQFKYHYEHFSFEGSHYDTKKHFDVVFKFLDEHFRLN